MAARYYSFRCGDLHHANDRKGRDELVNLGIVMLMYVSYCQLWMVVAANGLYLYLKDLIFKEKPNGTRQSATNEAPKSHMRKM